MNAGETQTRRLPARVITSAFKNQLSRPTEQKYNKLNSQHDVYKILKFTIFRLAKLAFFDPSSGVRINLNWCTTVFKCNDYEI